MGLESRRFARWQELRPLCLELIKGKHTPLGFRFTFQLSPENTEKLLNQTASPFSTGDVNGLALNIRYEDGKVICTTAVSLNLFTMDKSLEHAWEQMVQKFIFKAGADVSTLINSYIQGNDLFCRLLFQYIM